MLRLSLIALLLLAGCQEQPQPGRWSDYLDPYMAERGYTMSSDGETILKNGYAVWVDPICYGRACFSNRALVPTELAQTPTGGSSGEFSAMGESLTEQRRVRDEGLWAVNLFYQGRRSDGT